MEQKTLSAQLRTDLKKNASGRFRKAGKIPAVMYGNAGAKALLVDAHEFATKFHTISENTIIKLAFEKQSHDVLVKDFQENHLKGTITHIDFYEISAAKTVRTHVPVHTTGTPKGVREGGILDIHLHEVEVECLPKDLIHEITVDLSGLEAGHAIHVSNLPAFPGVKYLSKGDQVIASIVHAKAEAAPAAAEEAAPAAAST